jgi:hypothetical protein
MRRTAASNDQSPVGRDLELLALIARLPLIPAPCLGRITGDQAAVYRGLARLRRLALVAAVGCQPRARGRPAQLLQLTARGRALLTGRAAEDGTGQTWPCLSRGLRPHQLARLLTCYELLPELARTHGGPATLVGWEQPWRRAYRPASGHPVRRLSMPAAATLAWPCPGPPTSRSYLLVPDLGGISLPAWRRRLHQLAPLAHAYGEPLPELAISTTSDMRAAAWRRLLAEAGAADRDRPVSGQMIGVADARRPGLAVLHPTTGERRIWPLAVPLGTRDLALLDVIGRHPFLTATLLAALLGVDQRWLRRRLARLCGLGLVRAMPPTELTAAGAGGARLLELTHSGLHAAAAELGVPLAAAVRQHGLTGGGATAPFGPRAALLAQPAHTLGADRVIVGLAAAARADPRGGYLAEWRNAAACAHGRLRPDAYGVLHVLGHDCGFFLEFDRGTMRPAELRAKFAAYHHLQASRRAAQLYTSFPTVLVVTTGGPGAEHRLADALRAVGAGFAAPLPTLLTTTAWIDAHTRGMLGAIWRTPQQTSRRAWPRLASFPNAEVTRAS